VYRAPGVVTLARRPNPRIEYRRRRAERVNSSPNLSEKFPKLKNLSVIVDFFDPNGVIRQGGLKYKVNLEHGKSLFCFNCVNPDCVGGDYDLTQALAQSVAARKKVAEGELRCQGSRQFKDPKRNTPCRCVLRYKLALGY
jgi:hypothetical protein